MQNFLNQEVSINDKVVFIRNQRGTTGSLQTGTVIKVNEKSVSIDSNGKTYRVMFSTSPSKDKTKLLKVIVMKDREERIGEPEDYTGYPIREGDTIAFTENVYQGAIESFIIGTVTGITSQNVNIISDNIRYAVSRRTFDRVIVINGFLRPDRKPRAPRKKKVVPNFVIQNNAEDSITYASVVEKIQAAVTIQDVTSLDIYVKAEEGKAYYVVNGEAAGAVDLFLD